MKTRNQYPPEHPHRNEPDYRRESFYYEDWRSEPFQEFRQTRRNQNNEGRYEERDQHSYSGERNRWEDDQRPFYRRSYESYRNDPRADYDQRSRFNSYREQDDPWYEGNSHSRRDDNDYN